MNDFYMVLRCIETKIEQTRNDIARNRGRVGSDSLGSSSHRRLVAKLAQLIDLRGRIGSGWLKLVATEPPKHRNEPDEAQAQAFVTSVEERLSRPGGVRVEVPTGGDGSPAVSAPLGNDEVPPPVGTSLDLPEIVGKIAAITSWRMSSTKKPSNRLDYDRRTPEERAKEAGILDTGLTPEQHAHGSHCVAEAKYVGPVLDTGVAPEAKYVGFVELIGEFGPDAGFTSGGTPIYEDYSAPLTDETVREEHREAPSHMKGPRAELSGTNDPPPPTRLRDVAYWKARALRGDQRAIHVLAELARGSDGN